MSTPIDRKAKKPASPICPHCHVPLVMTHMFDSIMGPNGEPVVQVLTYCSGCMKPVPCSVFPVPMVPARRRDPNSGGLIDTSGGRLIV